MSNEVYELVFYGPKDDAPETLRELKSSLLTHLNYSAEEAKRILSAAPFTLQIASNKQELKARYIVLKRAGAKVKIVVRLQK